MSKQQPISTFIPFIQPTEEEQVTEIEEYLKARKFDIIVDEDDAEVIDRLHRISEICREIFGNPDTPESELEGLLYSIGSFFHIIEYEEARDLLENMCIMITTGADQQSASHKVRLLQLLFTQLGEKEPLSSMVMTHLIKMVAKTGSGPLLDLDMTKLKKWFKLWNLPDKESQSLLKHLWEAYKSSSQKGIIAQILIELLRSFTSSPSNVLEPQEAKQLAKELILLLLAEPDRYILDFTMSLAPVKALKGDKLYRLLDIFINEKLSSFNDFCVSEKAFFDSLGLDHEVCQQKMRVLTVISLAGESQEVPFSRLCSELCLSVEELDQFVIDTIRLKLLSARMDHVNQKLLVSNCVQRSFGMDQWKQIQSRLSSWKENLKSFRMNLDSLSLQHQTKFQIDSQ